jgi:hypothetical protein
MSDDTTSQSALYADHRKFLKEMVEKYDLEDEGKALRVLVTYAMQDGNLDDIYKGIRCRHCG